MLDSFFKLLNSARLVQEVSQFPNSSSAALGLQGWDDVAMEALLGESPHHSSSSSSSPSEMIHDTQAGFPVTQSIAHSIPISTTQPRAIHVDTSAFSTLLPTQTSIISESSLESGILGLDSTSTETNASTASSVPSDTTVYTHSRETPHSNIRHHPKQSSPSKSLHVVTTYRRSGKLQYATSPKTTEAGLTLHSERAELGKLRSQKQLHLWPLPTVTKYVIILSLIVSTLSYFDIIDVSCSSPSFVIYRREVPNLFLSPLLFKWTLSSFLLFSCNLVLFGLFEESLIHVLGGTWQFVVLLLGVLFSVSTLRQGLGYLFSRSTGWAFPTLFFSDSIHECNNGLAPFLFALLIVQSLSIDDKYILIVGDEDAKHEIAVYKVMLQLVMCLFNYISKSILWWSMTGILIGFFAAIIAQAWIAYKKQDVNEWGDESPQGANHTTVPLWRQLWNAIKKGALMVMVTLFFLLICNLYYVRDQSVDPAVLNQMTQDRYLYTFVIMTAPRRGDPPLLSKTVDSYLANWPTFPEPGSLYSRIQMIVYTHFTQHAQFDETHSRLANDTKAQHYVKWIKEDGDQMDQRLHVSRALDMFADEYKSSSYIVLLEDDFPICGQDGWRELDNVVYRANQYIPEHCGIFVATGGSGLLMKPNIAKLVAEVLIKYQDIPPDVIVQKCLRGDFDECSQCSQTLVTSKELLMYHIGHNSSTSGTRRYKIGQYQCGWRQPFNGDPNVITL